MTFFNKKEDVIKIELTPHGRKLLSKGKLKPSYYAFFDDDILYDSGKGGFSETNLLTKTRILNETPRVKPQTNFKGVESKVYNEITFETENQMLSPIGSNRIEYQKTNGWDISFLHNTASSATNYLSADTSPTLPIPQIEAIISYKLQLARTEDALATDSFKLIHEDLTRGPEIYVNVTEEQVMLNILETNGFNENDGLEVEIFLYEQDQQTYKKLQSFKKESLVEDDLYIEPITNNNKSLFEINETTENPNLVEYWLRIKVDEEIPLVDRCSGIKNLENNNIYLEEEFICPDDPGALPDIYSTSISDLEDCEE